MSERSCRREVTLDGKPLGKSNGCSRSARVARVEIVLDGRRSEVRQVEVSEGRITRVAVELKPEEDGRPPRKQRRARHAAPRNARLRGELKVTQRRGVRHGLADKGHRPAAQLGRDASGLCLPREQCESNDRGCSDQDHAAEQPRIERLLAAAGRLQFLLLANERDQKAIVDRARHWPPAANMPSCQPFWANMEQTRGHTTPSKAGRLPVKPPPAIDGRRRRGAEASLAGRPNTVMRTRKQQQGSVAKVVVLSAPYNVTDEHILGTAPGNCNSSW